MTDISDRTVADYRVRPDFIIRVASLPVTVFDDINTPATAAALAEVRQLADWLRVEAAAISDELYSVIGQLTGHELKPRLVALRRAVYQVRAVRRLLDQRLTGALPEPLLTRMHRWAAERDRHSTLVADLPDVLEADTARALAALRRVATHPDLHRGLVLSSPTLLAELRAWLASGPWRSPQRRVLASLMRYIGRMAMKTSPVNTFTFSGFGSWAPVDTPCANGGSILDRGYPRDRQRRYATEFHRGLVTGVAERLTKRPELAEHVRVRLNPSLVRDGSTLRFLEPPPSSAVVSVRASTTTDRALTFVGTSDRTLAAFRQALSAEPDAATLVRLADRLIELGLIERFLPVPDSTPDPLGSLAAWVRTAASAPGRTDLAATADRLDRLHHLGARYAAVDDTSRLADLLDDIGSVAGGLLVDLGIARRPGDFSVRTSFFENTLLTGAVTRVDPAPLRGAFDALNALRRLSALFDPALPFRVALAEYLTQRWGPGARVPLLSLYYEIHRESGGPEPSVPDRLTAHRVAKLKPAWGASVDESLSESPVPRLRELAHLRAEVLREFGDRPVDADGVQRITTREVLDHVNQWPPYVVAPASMGIYAQLVQARDPLLVVNVAGSGYGRGHGRTQRLAGRSAGRGVGPGDDGDTSAGMLHAEIDHPFGTNLNTRVPQLRYCIDYPGHVPHRPPEHRIPLAELVAVHDDGSGLLRLEWERGKLEVRPVHTGMYTEMWLPAPASFLIWGFGDPPTLLHPIRPLLGRSGRALAGDEVRRRPRQQIGPVVIRRASWFARAGALPARGTGEDDTAWMLRLLEWLRANGIPDRCFVRLTVPGDGGAALLSKIRKPLYVDFTNWFLVLAFERSLVEPDRVVIFDEVLPTPHDASCMPAWPQHVTELLFDLDAVADG